MSNRAANTTPNATMHPEPLLATSQGNPTQCHSDGRKVVAVVVTHNPDPGELERLTSALLPQVNQIVVVDNGSRDSVAERLCAFAESTVTCLMLGTNIGVAAALNRGISLARRNGAKRVILFDQDSVPAPDMVEQLMRALDLLESARVPVAAVGPRFRDPRADNPPPFIRIRRGRVVRLEEAHGQPAVEVDYLITSGSLIPATALDRVGLFEERLFIDYVDIEWGLRAKREGFSCFGVFAADMEHSLGETPLQFAGTRFPVHSALRHYYHFRNATWLTRQAQVPLQWKFVNGYRLLGKFIVYACLATPRLDHVRMMTRGIRHGFKGRLGQYV